MWNLKKWPYQQRAKHTLSWQINNLQIPALLMVVSTQHTYVLGIGVWMCVCMSQSRLTSVPYNPIPTLNIDRNEQIKWFCLFKKIVERLYMYTGWIKNLDDCTWFITSNCKWFLVTHFKHYNTSLKWILFDRNRL